MPNSLGATYIVSPRPVNSLEEDVTFFSLKEALALIKGLGYDDWKVVRRETIEQVVASSLEQDAYQ